MKLPSPSTMRTRSYFTVLPCPVARDPCFAARTAHCRDKAAFLEAVNQEPIAQSRKATRRFKEARKRFSKPPLYWMVRYGGNSGTQRDSAVIMIQRQRGRRTGGHLRKLPLSSHFANRSTKKSVIDDVAAGLIVVRHIVAFKIDGALIATSSMTLFFAERFAKWEESG